MAVASEDRSLVRVWDPLVRIGHWLLVAAFATAYLTEGEPEWLHTNAGYLIAIVVALRIVWGFVGPERARFRDFVTGPGRAASYLVSVVSGRAERHLGHSPAGGVMTIALLAALALTAVTGMAQLAVEEGEGPLAPLLAPAAVSPALVAPAQADENEAEGRAGEGGESERESAWGEAHEVLANLALVLVVLHIGGVVLASVVHRENLPLAMITGRKRP